MVIVIEDEQIAEKAVANFLKDKIEDYKVFRTAESAEDYLAIEGQKVNLIVLDLVLPVRSGFDFLDWKEKADQFIKNIPVIVVTSLTETTELIAGKQIAAIIDKNSGGEHFKRELELAINVLQS
jgi:two-component system alkaline phosphatase synthesis response regulator PhoP